MLMLPPGTRATVLGCSFDVAEPSRALALNGAGIASLFDAPFLPFFFGVAGLSFLSSATAALPVSFSFLIVALTPKPARVNEAPLIWAIFIFLPPSLPNRPFLLVLSSSALI